MTNKKHLLLGTRKGLVTYRKNHAGKWVHDQTHFLGIPVSLATIDSVTNTWWALLDHGHWGCKLHRSVDGLKWEEVPAPKYPEGTEVKSGVEAATRYLWAFSNLGPEKPGHILIGTEPGGLFYSTNNGDSFDLVTALWNHPTRQNWFGGGRDYPGIHSILVDPRNTDHIYVGISCAGVLKSEDGGNSWKVKNKGLRADFLPDPDSEIGQDPHLVVMSPSHPEVMWQQNHCGIFKTENSAEQWQEVSQPDGPANFGFAVAVHETNPSTAWVVPGVSDEVRVAIDQALCVCRTDDGGQSWQEYREGLPQSGAYDIVYRHALDVADETVAFGTTTGNLYLSEDGGETWETLNGNLPMVYSLEFHN